MTFGVATSELRFYNSLESYFVLVFGLCINLYLYIYNVIMNKNMIRLRTACACKTERVRHILIKDDVRKQRLRRTGSAPTVSSLLLETLFASLTCVLKIRQGAALHSSSHVHETIWTDRSYSLHKLKIRWISRYPFPVICWISRYPLNIRYRYPLNIPFSVEYSVFRWISHYLLNNQLPLFVVFKLPGRSRKPALWLSWLDLTWEVKETIDESHILETSSQILVDVHVAWIYNLCVCKKNGARKVILHFRMRSDVWFIISTRKTQLYLPSQTTCEHLYII